MRMLLRAPFWHSRSAYVLVLFLYIIAVSLTASVDFGDTIYYVDEILRFNSQPDPAAQRVLLDFGHLLWRPLGLALFNASSFFLPVSMGAEAVIRLTKLLVGVSLFFGAAATVLMFGLLRRLNFPP